MKGKIIGAGGIFLLIALAAIFGWYFVHTRGVQAELDRLEAEFKSRTPVNVSFVVSVPENTPKDQTLYLSGSVPALGNWDAAGVPLQRSEDGKYVAQVPELLNGLDYAFKVTRGTWGTVETDKSNKPIDNHAFTAKPDAKVEVAVAEWVDSGKAVPGRVTMVPGVRLEKKFKSTALGNERTLIVYLPPDYEKETSKRYPVLYMQDGQNLMDEATSYQGIEWGIDEAANKLIASGQIEPAIIVGVYNTETRAAEFDPKAKGDAYAKMMAEEIKPFIDQKYRTQADKPNTMIGGGSMGAMISLHTAKKYPSVYGKIVALSPWLRVNDKAIGTELLGDGSWLKGTKLFMNMGTDAGHNYPGDEANALADAEAFVAELEKAGLVPGKDFDYREVEGDKHNESTWAASIDQVLIAVLGKPAAATQPI